MATTSKTTTTPKKTTTTTRSRTTTTKKTTAKTAAPAAPAPTVIEETRAVVSGPEMGKRELMDAVVAKTGQKMRDVKPVVEAALHVLGASLQGGRDLNLQPFGKLIIKKEQQKAQAKVMEVRVRQSTTFTEEDMAPRTAPDTRAVDAVTPAAE